MSQKAEKIQRGRDQHWKKGTIQNMGFLSEGEVIKLLQKCKKIHIIINAKIELDKESNFHRDKGNKVEVINTD